MLERAPIVDAETVAAERPRDHKAELRLWLRLLTCATLIEDEIRSRLRAAFDVTLPRFDLMAQLHKNPDGMTLSQLSGRMMVSNGNLTALVERLAEAGHVERRPAENDRRAVIVRLTPDGDRAFAAMAARHEDWIADLLEGLSEEEVEELMTLLAKLKASTREAIARDDREQGR